MMHAKRLCYLTLSFFAFIFASAQAGEKLVDLIAFSYNRPLQLYALLESAEHHLQGLNKTYVIYLADNEDYQTGYQKVRERFNNVTFLQQPAPKQQFKELLLRTLDGTTPYVMFAVDDIIVKDPVDLNACTNALKQTNAYGFFLRLGKNITHCYMLNCPQQVPPLKSVTDDIHSWRFGDSKCDWEYAQTVDMTVYHKKDMLNELDSLSFTTPNQFEAIWNKKYHRSSANRTGLCFAISRIINIPLNIVQSDYSTNRTMAGLTPEMLLTIFNCGKKFDIASVYGFIPTSPHVELNLGFIDR